MKWSIAAFVIGGGAVLMLAPDAGVFPTLGLALSAALGIASLAPLAGRNLRRTPLHLYGMVIAHFGVAVSIAGMASETAFSKEVLVAARPGQSYAVGPFDMTFAGVRPTAGNNWSGVEAVLLARKGEGGAVVTLNPQQRFFASPPTETSEAALSTHWDGQLYAVIGQRADEGRWQLRLWWKPFVTLIWYGALLIALGGLISLIGRVRGKRAPKPEVTGYRK
jgi:cytochrome c-type biogenesis protein CcmF